MLKKLGKMKVGDLPKETNYRITMDLYFVSDTGVAYFVDQHGYAVYLQDNVEVEVEKKIALPNAEGSVILASPKGTESYTGYPIAFQKQAGTDDGWYRAGFAGRWSEEELEEYYDNFVILHDEG